MEHLKIRTIEEGSEWMAQQYGLPDSGTVVAAKISALMDEHYRRDVLMNEGVLDWLNYFREEGIPMAIATNTDRELVRIALQRWDLEKYFTAIFTTAEVGAGKGHPDVFEAALKHLGTPKERTWVFEDAPFAMETAKHAGFPVAGVFGSRGQDDIGAIKALADFCIPAFSQVKPWF